MAMKNTRVSPGSSQEPVSSPCPYDGTRLCNIHDEFAILKSESDEIDELLHNNWKEIEWLWNRVDLRIHKGRSLPLNNHTLRNFPFLRYINMIFCF